MRKGFAGAAVPTTTVEAMTAGSPSSANELTVNQAGLETDTTGWEVDTNCTISRSTAQALDGSASLAMTSVAAGEMKARTTYATWVPVAVGATYQASAWYRAATTARSCLTMINWFTSADAYISTSAPSAVANTTTGWTQVAISASAPATAAKAQIIVDVIGTGAAGEVHYVDRIAFASAITLADSTGWVFTTMPFVVVVDRGAPTEEKILCANISGTTLTVQQRGYDGTTAAAHNPGAEIIHTLDSLTVDEANAWAGDGAALIWMGFM